MATGMTVSAAALGRLRAALLAERLLGWPATVTVTGSEAQQLMRERAWAQGFSPDGLCGLAAGQVPTPWRAALAWIGMPLAPAGALCWGEAVRASTADAIHVADGILWLPQPARLHGLTSIALRPARRFVAEHCGCRLQAGAGLQLFCWPDALLVLNCRDVPLAGFLHGPSAGRRAAFTLAPGEPFVQVW